MKYLISSLLATALFINSTLVLAQAQQRELATRPAMNGNPNSISLQYGAGIFALLRNESSTFTVRVNDIEQGEYSATFTGNPATSLNYDRQLGKLVSIGGTISRQQNSVTNIRNLADDTAISGRLNVNRTLIGARLLFHYGNSPKVDMYSGIRAGITHWNVKASGEVRDLDFDSRRLGPSVGVITPQVSFLLFGVNFNIDQNFYAGGELCAGSPHIGAVQFGYRF